MLKKGLNNTKANAQLVSERRAEQQQLRIKEISFSLNSQHLPRCYFPDCDQWQIERLLFLPTGRFVVLTSAENTPLTFDFHLQVEMNVWPGQQHTVRRSTHIGVFTFSHTVQWVSQQVLAGPRMNTHTHTDSYTQIWLYILFHTQEGISASFMNPGL